MLKKVLSVLLVLLFCFGVSLPTFALTDEQGWTLTYQIQNLPEEHRELYVIIPNGAYCSEEKVTAKNVLYGNWGTGPEGVLIQELFDTGVFVRPEKSSNNPEWENNPDVTSAPASEVKRVYEETFGPGSFEYFKHKESFTNYGDRFRYNTETDRYEYLCCPFGGGVDNASVYASFEKAEETEGSVILYVRYGGYQSAAVSSDGVFKMYRDSQMRVLGEATPYYTSLTGEEEDLLRSGILDEYLPLYKHTFRDNGAGGYYWESTQMVQQENVERIKAVLDEAKNSAQSSANSSANNSAADPVTDSEGDSSSVVVSDGNTSDEKRYISIPIWVCIGAAAVALVSMFVPVLINKKNGKE